MKQGFNIILIGRAKFPKRISIVTEVTEKNLNSKVHKNSFKKQNLLEYCADILNLLFFFTFFEGNTESKRFTQEQKDEVITP